MGFVSLYRRGLWIYAFIIVLLVGMSWADVLSVMLARGVIYDISYPRQEERRGFPPLKLRRGDLDRGSRSWAVDFIGDRRSFRC